MPSKSRGFSTKAVHAGETRDPLTGSITTPIYQTSTFGFSSTEGLIDVISGKVEGYVYTRFSNPTTRVVEKKVAELECAEDGAAFSSGMEAVATTVITLVSSGSHIISIRDVYGGTFSLLSDVLPKFGVEVSMVEATDLDGMESAVKENTRIIYVESPTNPTLKIVDLSKVAKLSLEKGTKLIVDNTFASPYNQKPLQLGADVVIHSATKYLGGHNDVTAGIVVGQKDFIHSLKDMRKIFGGVLDPHAAWLLLRGLKTLGLRMEKHNLNGMKVARYLEEHPKVKRVHYPGLTSHSQHSIVRKQMKGFGGVVSFELKGGLETATKFVDSLKLSFLSPSLGGAETLVTQPATSSHYYVPREERLKIGITDELIRLALGIEDPEDIIADLDQAFNQID